LVGAPEFPEATTAEGSKVPVLPPRLFGLRTGALVLTGAAIIALFVIDMLFGDGTRFRDAVPHPFWALVILISVHYGTSEALIAALAATAALLVGNLPPMTPETQAFDLWLSAVSQPIGWFITGLGLGELAWRRIERIAVLEAKLKTAAAESQEIAGRYDALSAAHAGLRERMTSDLGNAVGLYRAAQALERQGPGDVLGGMADLVRQVLRPRSFSIFVLKDGALEQIVSDGWAQSSTRAERYTSVHPLYRAVVLGRRNLCAADRADETILESEGLLAVPLVCGETDRIVGMLKIEGLDFADLTAETLRNAKALGAWLGTAYARATAHAAADAGQMLSRERTVFSAGFFEHNSALLAALGRRAGFDVSLAIVNLPDHESVPETERGAVSEIVAKAVRESLRETDIAFEYRRTGWEFAVLLPMTDLEHARSVSDRLRASIDTHLQDAGYRHKIALTVESLTEGAEPEQAAATA
jgi:hypothetical protein